MTEQILAQLICQNYDTIPGKFHHQYPHQEEEEEEIYCYY